MAEVPLAGMSKVVMMSLIEFDDYRKDMADQAERAAYIIKKQREEIDMLKRMFSAAVLASGGELRIPYSSMVGQRAEFECHDDPNNGVRIYSTKEKQPWPVW